MGNVKLYIAWIFLFIVSVPLALDLVPHNSFYGFRTASTLANPEVWRWANIFAGWTFVISAALGLAITYIRPDIADSWEVLLLVGIVIIATVVSFVHLKLITP